MRFACPGCKTMITAEEEDRGNVIACSDCGKKLRVPAAKVTAAKSPARPAPAKTSPKPAPPENDDSDDEPRPTRKAVKQADDDDEGTGDDEPPKSKKKKRKKKRQPTSAGTSFGIFGGFGTLILILAFLYLFSGRSSDNAVWVMVREFLEDTLGIHPLLAIGITAALGLIPLGIWMLFTTKSAVLAGMPNEMDFKATKVEKFKDIDEDKLAEYTQAFEGLGFKRLMDYTVETEIDLGNKGFARLMVNETEHCFAEINQAFIGDDAAIPMRCSLCTIFEDGWSLNTSDRTATKESYIMRRPRGIWESRPDDDPSDLVEAHMKLRKKMIRKLKVEIAETDTAQAYFQSEKRANRERKEAVQGRWTHGLLLDMWFFDRKPKREWMGEMP